MYSGEITLEANYKRKDSQHPSDGSRRSGGARVDAKFVAASCEYYVIEAAKRSPHDGSGAKYDNDFMKLGRHLRDMLNALNFKYGNNILDGQRFRLLGSLADGPVLRTYSLTQKGYTSLIYLMEKHEVPESTMGIHNFLDILGFTARLKRYLETMVHASYRIKKPKHFIPNRVPQCSSTPRKSRRDSVKQQDHC